MAKTSGKGGRFSDRARNRQENASESLSAATSAAEHSPQPAPASVTPITPEPAVKRIAVPVDTATGKAMLETMRPATIAELKTALDSDSARAVLGNAAAVATSTHDPALNAALVGVLFDSLGAIGVALASRKGYSDPAAAKLAFNDRDKAILTPPTVRVLEKYNVLGGKYADEIALAAALLAVIAGKAQEMNAAEELFRRETGAAA